MNQIRLENMSERMPMNSNATNPNSINIVSTPGLQDNEAIISNRYRDAQIDLLRTQQAEAISNHIAAGISNHDDMMDSLLNFNSILIKSSNDSENWAHIKAKKPNKPRIKILVGPSKKTCNFWLS